MDPVFEEIKEGDRLPTERIGMDREEYFSYNRLVKEINPLHFTKKYAEKLGFKDIVVAGVYTFSFIPRMIESWAGEAGRISGIDIRYENPVYIEETIVQKAHVKRKVAQEGEKYVLCEVSVEDGEGNLLSVAEVTVDFS